MLGMDDNRKIGLGLTSFGVLFLFLGVMLFFDRGLLAMGNLMFLGGVTLLIGPSNTAQFFFQWRKARGTALFLGGIVLVLMGYTFIGIIVEAFGFLNLFGDFFPVVISFLRALPGIGHILDMPMVRQVTDVIFAKRSTPV